MKITDSRATDILRWLDDETGNHALLFEKMTLHRDAAALIRQLQAADGTKDSLLRAAAVLVRELDAAEQATWHAGLDAGREQGRGKDHAHQPPSASVEAEVEGLVAKWRNESKSLNIHIAGRAARRICACDLERALEAVQPAAVGLAEAGIPITPLPRPPAAQPRA